MRRKAPRGASEEPKRQGARPLHSSCKPVVSCPHSSRAPLAPAPRALAPLPPLTPRWQPTRSFKRPPAQAQASTARRGAQVPFFPSAGNAALPQPQGARARLAPPQPPPRGGAAASAHALATAAARRGARAGRFGPKKRAASRSRLPARQEESLRWLGAGRAAYGARRRQAAATGAVRAALLYAAVARPSCRAIGRGAAC